MNNPELITSIEALLNLDAKGALYPHGIGGLARDLFTQAIAALSGSPQVEAGTALDPDIDRAATAIQNSISRHLYIGDGEIMGIGPASYQIARSIAAGAEALRPREQEGGEAPLHAVLNDLASIDKNDTLSDWMAEDNDRMIAAAHPAPLPADGWKEGIEAAAKQVDYFERLCDVEYHRSKPDHANLSVQEAKAALCRDLAKSIRSLPTPPASTEGGK